MPSPAIELTIAFLLRCALGGSTSRSRRWVMKGDVNRESEIDCGWSSPPSTCPKDRERIRLQPGQVYVVDNFLDAVEDSFLAQVRRGLHLAQGARREILNTSFVELTELPPHLESLMLRLLKRIHGHAVANIFGETSDAGREWTFNDTFHVDHWAFRRYDGRRLEVHSDSGHFGRCLSATLHIGEPDGDCCKGGQLETFRCKKGDCTAFGWDYDSQKHKGTPEELLQDDNLMLLSTMRYRPGRLVFFLAESLHAVSEVMEGTRDVLFMWFSCVPTLINGAIANGHAQLVQHLVQQKADVNEVIPTTGDPLIHIAAGSGFTAVLSLLLEHRANPDITQPFEHQLGARPFHFAAAAGHILVLQLLLNAQADPGSQELRTGFTPIHRAAEHGHLEVTKFLTDLLGSAAAAVGDVRDPDQGSPLEIATNGARKAVKAYPSKHRRKSSLEL